MEPIIQGIDLHKSFGSLEVLRGIDVSVQPGELVSIVGPSGAGKTTLLQLLGTLDRPTSGRILLAGRDISRLGEKEQAAVRNTQIGFVFQFHHLLPEFTAVENVAMPALIAGKSRSQALEMAKEMLQLLNLSDRLHHKPSELSGGENQRVAVARALVNHPCVVLADEPSGSLDSRNKAELHRLFLDLRDRLGQTFVVVTHDMDLAHQTDRIIEMRDGLIG